MTTKHLPIIEFHILQSFPVSCLNRDDVGAPKQAVVGGVTRARVSSQCWKRAVRLQLRDQGVRLGLRTKKVAEVLCKEIQKKIEDPEKAKACADEIAKYLSDDSLLFLSESEYDVLADYAEKKGFEPGKMKDKDVQKLISKPQVKAMNGLDIALFGRMVAKAVTMKVEAAASFSHAISTHAVGSELDFFTAMDDQTVEDPEGTGAGHMGTAEFNSATYYRYISLNLAQLAQTLGLESFDGDMEMAVAEFVKALYLGVPAARQATMSASNCWDFARIYVRHGQRMQCVFEKPVLAPRQGGYLEASIVAMKAELAKKEKQAGSLFGKVAEFDFGGDSDESIDSLIEKLLKAARG